MVAVSGKDTHETYDIHNIHATHDGHETHNTHETYGTVVEHTTFMNGICKEKNNLHIKEFALINQDKIENIAMFFTKHFQVLYIYGTIPKKTLLCTVLCNS